MNRLILIQIQLQDFNFSHFLGWFIRWQTDDVFLTFPRKQDLTVKACKLSQFETVCMKYQNMFSGKNKENISKGHLNFLSCKLMMFFLVIIENRIWHFIQIVFNGDSLHEMSIPVFWGKKTSKFCLVNFLPSMLSIRTNYLIDWL